VSIPLTLTLTVPATTPDVEYVRATIRAQQLEALFTEPVPFAAKAGAKALVPTSNDARYGDYLLARAVERREDAVAFPWSRWLATLELMLLILCIGPAGLAIVTLAKRRRA